MPTKLMIVNVPCSCRRCGSGLAGGGTRATFRSRAPDRPVSQLLKGRSQTSANLAAVHDGLKAAGLEQGAQPQIDERWPGINAERWAE